MSKKNKWLFFTAGLGSPDFEASATRLVEQAASFELFDTVKAFTTEEVLELCPRLTKWYGVESLTQIKGYGWYTWKPTLADLVIRQKMLGEFDGFMYLDSGCEMFLSSMSKKRLASMMDNAISHGATLFAIPTPEIWHSKNDLLKIYNCTDDQILSNQFQSGSWLLSNSENSLRLVQKWEEVASKGPHMTDESPSVSGENVDFKVHRYDQAIFSLTCKELGFSPSRHKIPGSNQSYKYLIRAFTYPFWWSRNRYGKSVIPKFLVTLGKISLWGCRK